MWKLLIVVTALCGSVQAFYPTWAIDEAVEKAYKDVEAMLPMENLRIGGHLAQDEYGGPERCMLCVKATTRHIMESVIDHLKKMCESTKCPFLQKKCAQAKEHPGVAFGYLLDRVHAMDKSVAYCYGRRACPHPPVGHHCCCGAHCDSNDMAADMMPEHEFARHLENMNLFQSPALMGQAMQQMARNEGNQTCVECIEGTACCVTEAAVHMIGQWCEKTECPCAKRMCDWAKEHKDVALGILVHRLRPGEWGCGWCFGKGTCHMPPHPNATMHFDIGGLVDKVNLNW